MSNANLSSILKDIRRMCFRCNGNTSATIASCPDDKCPLYQYRMKQAQVNFLDGELKRLWIDKVIEIALTKMPKNFWWSDLRKAVDIGVGHNNWWGGAVTKMRSTGMFRYTGRFRKSAIRSANGRIEREFERIG